MVKIRVIHTAMKQNYLANLLTSLLSIFKAVKKPPVQTPAQQNASEESVERKPDQVVDFRLHEEKLKEPENKKETVNFLLAFEIGVANYATDENTKRVRAIINDEFSGGAHGWDLQCTEYVQYRIQQIGLSIKWPVKNNRNGGNWAIIFEKQGPYRVLDIPKQNCAISFPATANNQFGHIAFVEEVNAHDESIVISEANWPKSGIYNKRPLLKAQWKDKYKARFIDFSDDTVVVVANDTNLVLGGAYEVERNTIFFAYSDKDKKLAQQIKFGLKKDFDIFLAYDDLDLSDKWSERIRNEIECRHFFIALRTENYFGSVIAEQECGIAVGLDKKIIPLFFVGVDPKDTGFLYESHGFIFDAQKTVEENCRELSEKLLLME